MRPQAPEHAVVALLQQCYLTPKCLASSIGSQGLPLISSRAVYTARPCRYRPQSAPRRQYRPYNTQSRRTRKNAPAETPNALLLGARRTTRTNPTLREPQTNNLPSIAAYSTPSQVSKNIAVLGAGITGLAAAHYLMRELPRAKITLYEAGPSFGGWAQSKHIELEDGKSVVFEQGPRSLRPAPPAGWVTLEMMRYLREQKCLTDELIVTYKDAESAQNRFVYYPDHLVRMPGPGRSISESLWSLLTEPIFKGLIRGALKEIFRENRPEDLEDESVGAFLERRLGSPYPGNNIVSAVLHGIYAGDIYQLSAKSLLPKLWRMEQTHQSFSYAMSENLRYSKKMMQVRDVHLHNAMHAKIRDELDNWQGVSVYTFKRGLGSLASAVELSLAKNPNVEMKKDVTVSALAYDGKSQKIKVTTTSDLSEQFYDNVISTVPSRTLSTLTAHLPSLSNTHSVTVMVVNLFYTTPDLLPERGFGYLLPRSLPLAQNPERALGVVFDTDATPGQDAVPGTKITVMLGGHWWDGFTSYPDEEEGLAMAKAVVKRHLGIEEQPRASNVVLQRECIPQYTVGHDSRMAKAHGELSIAFKGKLAVAGNSYTGVGLNDCVRAAYDVAVSVRDEEDMTGLEQFVGERKWAMVPMFGKGAWTFQVGRGREG